jgi:hypothetical protein
MAMVVSMGVTIQPTKGGDFHENWRSCESDYRSGWHVAGLGIVVIHMINNLILKEVISMKIGARAGPLIV